MILWNFIILVLTFFNFYVSAQHSFVSTKAIYYNIKWVPLNPLVSNRMSSSVEKYMCLSLTWLPFDVPEENCKKESNVFRGKVAHYWIEKTRSRCSKDVEDIRRAIAAANTDQTYMIDNHFENSMLHQISYLCGISCDDLVPEVNLDEFWKKIVDENKNEPFCKTLSEIGDAKNSPCPFSTRIDVQNYLFNGHAGHDHEEMNDNRELCIDRHGRKYLPPEGLGGKCVMFQHEFVKDGKHITELFMPIEKRDMIQRILEYPYTHEIRANNETLNRLLPSHDDFTNTSCLTLHHGEEMFFHCIYNTNDSSLFEAKDQNDFACPKSVSFTLNNTVQEDYRDHYIYTLQPVSSDYFEFAANCYISIEFFPTENETATVWNDPKVMLSMNLSMMGSKQENCPSKYFVSEISEYQNVMEDAMKDLCPWDNDISYTLCFKIQARQIMQHYGKLAFTLITTPVFDQCYYQSHLSNYGCYVIIDPLVLQPFRLPASWIKKLESNSLITSPKFEWNNDEPAAAFAFFDPELKTECLAKLFEMTESPIAGRTLDEVRYYFASHTKAFVARCNTPLCDAPTKRDEWVRKMKEVTASNPLNCFKGIRDKTIDTVKTNSSYTFFCSVQLSIYYENGQKIRKYNFTNNAHKSHPVEPKNCWEPSKLVGKMKNPDIDASQIDSCSHDFKTQTAYCCCRASKVPCNTVDIVDEYYDIANTNAEEERRRIQEGCRFDAGVSIKTEETCRKDSVRHDREMRCYGVFQIPSTTNKPKLIKENCYWPHPQYHDQYSIFCSNTFFEKDDLIDEKCVTLFINDFTSSTPSTATKEKIYRTLILCCNTGLYPERRESILSRSVVLL